MLHHNQTVYYQKMRLEYEHTIPRRRCFWILLQLNKYLGDAFFSTIAETEGVHSLANAYGHSLF